MPYIDTSEKTYANPLQEGTFINQFVEQLLAPQGWTKVKEFFKAYIPYWAYPKSVPYNIPSLTYAIARHVIVQNAEGKYLGISQQVTFTVGYSAGRRPGDLEDSTDPYFGNASAKPFDEWIMWYYENRVDRRRMFFYTLETVPEAFLDGAINYIILNSGQQGISNDGNDVNFATRAVLDVEVHKTENVNIEVDDTTGTSTLSSPYLGIYQITQDCFDPAVMQSPMCQIGYRAEYMENEEFPLMHTNWWKDSIIIVKGHISENNIFVTLQADTAPEWEYNAVPTIPLYFGGVYDIYGTEKIGYALFSGTAPQGGNGTSVAQFDFDDYSSTIGITILPLLKTYPAHPGNGLDNVIMARSKYGSRYQANYLSWGTTTNEIPPEREFRNRKYSRAYDPVENTTNYKWQFNPSRYTDKIHATRIFVMHPEEGVKGYLDASIGLNPKSISVSNLRVRQEMCPDKYDVYKFLPVSGISPLTKRPATAFRPIGLGVLDTTEATVE